MTMLTQTSADTLCTIIACGFINREANRTGKKTVFIYEPGSSEAERGKLIEKLRPYGVPLTLAEQDPKPKFPFIFAQTDYAPNAVVQGLADDLNHQFQLVETEINRQYSGTPLPGAYIGGLSSISSIHFCGGSDLYPYNPQYRENAEGSDPTKNKIVKAYDRAKTVSNNLADYLNRKYTSNDKIKWEVDNIGAIDASCACNQVFASVHGMTRSMIKYLANSDSKKVYLELALGADTSKVASCIPCSIFMSANGMPATATHLGRGDNWNFPKSHSDLSRLPAAASPKIPPTSQQVLLQNWYLEVNSCYNAGLNLLQQSPKVQSWIKEYQKNAAWKNHIPQLFLESLNFESSITKKKNHTQ